MTTLAKKTYQELRNLGVDKADDYFSALTGILKKVRVTSCALETGNALEINYAINIVANCLRGALLDKKKFIAVGNGGSAAIAMHALVDYANAGGLQTMDLMNPALVTCMANDYGYEKVFAKNIEMHVEESDVLFAISSSGQSPNILSACDAADIGCKIITFSGFSPENPLRKLGSINFYVPSSHYGFVELAHQILIHCILDFYLKKLIKERG
ncbi:SIS domain-containing protein [Patescibacteria group bacterium]|nr:SIS domain-containing protein [Patescibacteria group bacterium]